jgi:hypothetical protein
VAAIGSGVIVEADIADNAVTLAKMAGGTDGNIISYDASGDPVAVATGTDGQVLTSAGAGQPPAFEDAGGGGGGGAWNLIGTVVASDSASLTVTGLDSTYDTYAIALADMVIDSAVTQYGTYLAFRVGDSSGIDSGASDYSYHSRRYMSNSTTNSNAEVSTGASFIVLDAFEKVGAGTGEGFGGMFFLHRPGDGTMEPMISGQLTAHNNTGVMMGCPLEVGGRNAVITLDRIQVFAHDSTGTADGQFSTGRMTVWGIAHA